MRFFGILESMSQFASGFPDIEKKFALKRSELFLRIYLALDLISGI